MATSVDRNDNLNRPKKSEAQKRRRLRLQKARLVKLGMPEAKVAKLQADEVRTLLRRPNRVKKG